MVSFDPAIGGETQITRAVVVASHNEIGISVGFSEPSKLLWLSNPHIGADFVSGGGLNVYRISVGFPF